jgi:hypothetical protein
MLISPTETATLHGHLLNGLTVKQIVAQTGLCYTKINTAIAHCSDLRAARLEGKFQAQLKTGRVLGAPTGSVGVGIQGYSKTFVDWLSDQVPKGGTISDVLVSMAYDTYLDEGEATSETSTQN